MSNARETGHDAGVMRNEICHKADIAVKPVPREPLAYAAMAAIACAVAAASLIAAPGLPGFFGAALGLLMLAIAVIDARSFIIPNWLTAAALALGLANAAGEGYGSVLDNLLGAALRGILLSLAFYALREAYYRLRHRHGIGLGDVKLAAAAGAWLDWTLIPLSVEIAALAAIASYAVNQLMRRRPLDSAAKLPFGLFFAPAIWFCWLAGKAML
ncbi:MAG: A24 family peptidase [Beijerinckiaceae bacterium]|nr:A24 family peptidase [Beijerinckiaceae bacterium]